MWWQDATLVNVVFGTTVLGGISGAMGTFAVIRRQSLQGDAISHAALPGLALAFLIGARAPFGLILGAAASGWLAMIVVNSITQRSRVPFDTALGGVLAVAFGLGLVLMTSIQRYDPGSANHGLERYLFGQAATLRHEDLITILAVAAGILLLLVLFWRQFEFISFDPQFAHSVGVPVLPVQLLLMGMIVIAVVVGLQSVGVVLMSTLLIAPAVAARPWTNRLIHITLLASFLGGLAAASGTLLSHFWSGPRRPVPTGPAIVLTATAITMSSLFLRRIVHTWQLSMQREPT